MRLGPQRKTRQEFLRELKKVRGEAQQARKPPNNSCIVVEVLVEDRPKAKPNVVTVLVGNEPKRKQTPAKVKMASKRNRSVSGKS